jgi:hypothetical protein
VRVLDDRSPPRQQQGYEEHNGDHAAHQQCADHRVTPRHRYTIVERYVLAWGALTIVQFVQSVELALFRSWHLVPGLFVHSKGVRRSLRRYCCIVIEHYRLEDESRLRWSSAGSLRGEFVRAAWPVGLLIMAL